jgi:hypothetical protein
MRKRIFFLWPSDLMSNSVSSFSAVRPNSASLHVRRRAKRDWRGERGGIDKQSPRETQGPFSQHPLDLGHDGGRAEVDV